MNKEWRQEVNLTSSLFPQATSQARLVSFSDCSRIGDAKLGLAGESRKHMLSGIPLTYVSENHRQNEKSSNRRGSSGNLFFWTWSLPGQSSLERGSACFGRNVRDENCFQRWGLYTCSSLPATQTPLLQGLQGLHALSAIDLVSHRLEGGASFKQTQTQGLSTCNLGGPLLSLSSNCVYCVCFSLIVRYTWQTSCLL